MSLIWCRFGEHFNHLQQPEENTTNWEHLTRLSKQHIIKAIQPSHYHVPLNQDGRRRKDSNKSDTTIASHYQTKLNNCV